MFWADRIANDIEKRYADKIKRGEPLVIRDEKTVSGRVHVGSLRGVVIHGLISEILSEKGIANTYFFEINDYDPMDGLPIYLDKEKFEPYMGSLLLDVPSPDGKAASYAEYFAQDFIEAIEKTGYAPTFYRSSELYLSGRYDEAIRLALDNAEKIRRIYREVSGSEKKDDWYPLNVVCENCRKVSTTKVISWDGETVEYECADLDWAKGCGHRGRVSPFGGKAKLPWKVEWAAKFRVMNVDIEGAGKDHSTKGGSRDVAARIAREVFDFREPFNIPYEFFLIGGKKMSSSKGLGSSAKEVSELLPTEILRLAFLSKDYKQQINFEPDGDTIPVLFDVYDRAAEALWSGKNDDVARLFRLIHPAGERLPERHALPRFSTVAYLVQMPHVDMVREFEKLDGREYTNADKVELEKRANYARIWLERCAPEDFKFEIQKDLPESAKNISIEQKAALAKVLEYVKSKDVHDGQEMHTALHEIKKESGLDPKLFFEAIYFSILGKPSGPKAGWFLSVLDKDFLEKRLEEASR